MLRPLSLLTIALFAPGFLFAGNRDDKKPANESGVVVATPAPVVQPLIAFTAADQGDGTVQLKWSHKAPQAGVQYLVERSEDGVYFSTIATLAATNSRFLFLDDRDVVQSPAYYRISAKKGMKVQPVSHVVQLGRVSNRLIKMSAEEVLNGDQLQLNIFSQEAIVGDLKILNSKGDLVRQELLYLLDGYNRVMLPDYNDLQAGNYYLTLQTSEGLTAMKLDR